MTKKLYTYEDWNEGKVILIFSRRIGDSNPNLVDWEDFSEEEKIKIQEQQKSIFEQSVQVTSEKYLNGFCEDFSRTRSKIDLVNRLLKRLNEVFTGKMICDHYFCRTSDNNMTFDFWYYQDMTFYIDNHFIGGKKYDYSNVHSPNSLYWNQDMVMPEVMVEAIGFMIKFLKNEKTKLQLRIKPETKTTVNDVLTSDSSLVIPKTNPYPDIFSTRDAYDFFCELESSIVLEEEYVAGYAFIFHKLKDEKLNFPIKKNVRQVDFCDFLKKERGQKEIYPPKLPKRNPKRSQTIFEKCRETYLSSL